MKILILTTKTEHHDYFINKLNLKNNNINVIYEQKKIKFDFKTSHRLYKKRNKIEKKFFQNKKIKKNVLRKFFFDINSQESLDYINKLNPKVIISFGVGLISKKFLKKFSKKIILNLHGGNPQYYRGLDSHLWSIYHNDFNNLVTTLHKVDKKFDTGDILFLEKIPFNKKINFLNIRIFNTQICIKLVNRLVLTLKNKKKLKYKKQYLKGRYYSAMPSVLIDKCQKNFERWVRIKKQ